MHLWHHSQEVRVNFCTRVQDLPSDICTIFHETRSLTWYLSERDLLLQDRKQFFSVSDYVTESWSLTLKVVCSLDLYFYTSSYWHSPWQPLSCISSPILYQKERVFFLIPKLDSPITILPKLVVRGCCKNGTLSITVGNTHTHGGALSPNPS